MTHSLDEMFQGGLRLHQRQRGNRFNLDSIVLAGAIRAVDDPPLLDLGCGSGIISLAACYLHQLTKVVGIEIQTQLVELARGNVRMNRLEERIRILEGDVRRLKTFVEPASYPIVVCNPPFYPAGSGRLNPDPERSASRHELNGGLVDFLRAANYALVPKGSLFIIFPAYRSAELLAELPQLGLVPRWVQFVQPTPEQCATQVLVAAKKGGGPRLSVRPALMVRRQGQYSDEVRDLLAGRVPRYPGEELGTGDW